MSLQRSSLPPANEVWGKVIFSEACVKNSVHGGGLPHCMLGYPTAPPRADPPGAEPPLSRHPTGSSACWEIWATSGRYASYWNAILFCFVSGMTSRVLKSVRQVNHEDS